MVGTLERAVVVGAIGSGKTTLGRRLAAALQVPYVDLDALDLLPGWRHRPVGEFQSLVTAEASRPAWVMGGDFAAQLGPIAWPRAELIVWLDLPRLVTLGRTLGRTARQIRSREEVYPGSVQTLASVWRTGLLGFAVRHPGEKRRSHPRLLEELARPTTLVLHLRSTHAVERWIRSVEQRPR